jgi:hypothetical protein
MSNDAESLAKEIDQAFPLIGMPSPEEIQRHLTGCPTCEHLAADLESYRDKLIGVEVIRELHQEISHLSAKALQWILPYYLKYCLTPEAEYSGFETEFLIYSLAPVEEFEADVTCQLSLFNSNQIRVLRKFMAYLLSTDYWRSYCPVELDRGIAFLSKLLISQGL